MITEIADSLSIRFSKTSASACEHPPNRSNLICVTPGPIVQAPPGQADTVSERVPYSSAHIAARAMSYETLWSYRTLLSRRPTIRRVRKSGWLPNTNLQEIPPWSAAAIRAPNSSDSPSSKNPSKTPRKPPKTPQKPSENPSETPPPHTSLSASFPPTPTPKIPPITDHPKKSSPFFSSTSLIFFASPVCPVLL